MIAEGTAPTPEPTPPPPQPEPVEPEIKINYDWGSNTGVPAERTAKIAVASQQDTAPEQAARIKTLSDKTGVDSTFIQENLPEFEQKFKEANFSPEHLVENYPKLSKWISYDPQNFHIGKKDLPALKNLEWTLDDYASFKQTFDKLHDVNQVMDNINHTYYGARETGNILAGTSLKMASSIARIPNMTENLMALAPNFLNGITGVGNINAPTNVPTTNAVAEWFDKTAKNFDFKKEIEDQNYDRAGRVYLRKLAELTPMTAAILINPSIAVPLLTAGTAADVMNRPENKEAPPLVSAQNAAAHAAIFAATSKVTESVFEGLGETITKEYGSSAANAVVGSIKKLIDYAKGAAPGIVKGATTEAANFASMAVAGDVADLSVNPNALENVGEHAKDSAISGLVLGSALPLPHLLARSVNLHNEKMAVAQQDLMKTLETKLDKLNMKNVAPDQVEGMVSALTKDTPTENVYIDANALHILFQDKPDDLAKMASDLGIEHTLDEAKESGGTVQVPTSKWYSEKVDPETRKKLLGDVTFDPSLPTHNDVIKDHEIQDLREKIEKSNVADKSVADVQQNVFNQLVEAGHQPKDAQKISQVFALKMAVTAMDQNTTAGKLFAEHPLMISRELPELKPKDLTAPTPAMKPDVLAQIKKDISEYRWQDGGFNPETKQRFAGVHEGAPYLIEKGYSKADLTAAIDKTIAGKELTQHQQAIMDKIYKDSGYDKDHVPSGSSNWLWQKNLNDFEKQFKQSERGAFWVADDGAHIALLKDHDLSTALHESMHYFVHLLDSIVKSGDASPRTKEIADSLLKFGGAESFDKLTEAGHEKISDAFEVYLSEGKAPTPELRSAFAAFKVWMKQVYDGIRKFLPGVKLNQEIRSAFDRMLATDEEIKQAKELMGMRDLYDEKQPFMNDKDWAAYQKAKADRDEASDEYLTKKLLKPIIKRKKMEYRNEREEIERDIADEVNKRPEYQLLEAIKNSKLPDGRELAPGELKLSRKETVALVGADIVKEMPGGIFSADGEHPDSIAAKMSDEMSGTELVMLLANSHPKKDVIKHETDAEMARRHGHEDPMMNGDITDEAINAVHSGDHAAEAMAYELQWMKENQKGQYNSLLRKTNKRLLTAKYFGEKAQGIVNNMPTRDLKPYVFKRAEAKHGNDALAAFIKGDFEKAFESRYRELLNHELYKKVQTASDYLEKAFDDFGKFDQKDSDLAKTREPDLVNAIRAILDKFEIVSEKVGRSAEDYLKKLNQYGEDDAYRKVMAQITPVIDGARHYGDIPFDQFVEMKESVDAIWDLSKTLKEIEKDGKRESTENIINPMKDRLAVIDQDKAVSAVVYGPTGKKKGWARTVGLSAKSALARVEYLMHAWDGGDPNGIFTTYIHQPIFEAEQIYIKKEREYRKKVDALVKEHLKGTDYDEKMIASDILAPDTRFENKGALITYLLHTGNESNLKKLLIGYGWGSLDPEGNLDRSRHDAFVADMIGKEIITKSDMDFVQSIWDLLEGLKPESQKAHKRKYGSFFKEIENAPVHTPWGEYRGGYFPAVVDAEWCNDRENKIAREFLEKNFDGQILPQAPNGFTKTRIDGYNQPLSLDLGLINAHINQVLKFSYIGPAVSDVSKLLYSKELSKAIKEHDETLSKFTFDPWLQRTANQSYYTPSKFKMADTALRYIRNNTAMQRLVFNVPHLANVVQHGYTLAALKVRPDFLMSAQVDYIKSPTETVNFITSHSTFMENRLKQSGNTMELTLKDIVVNPSKFKKVTDFIGSNAFFVQHMLQSQIDTVVWKGAFDQAAKDGHVDEEATKIADAAVSQTQHTTSPSSMSGIEHGSALWRVFTSMYSFQNQKANLMGSEYYKSLKLMGIKKGMGRAVYSTMVGSALTAFNLAILGSILHKTDLTEGGELGVWEGFAKKWAKNIAQDTFGMFPIVGKVANYELDKFTGNHSYDPTLSLTPVEETLAGAGRTVNSLVTHTFNWDEEFKDKEIKDGLNALGLVTGTPLGPLQRPVGYLMKVNSGKIQPTGSVDFARGLIIGH